MAIQSNADQSLGLPTKQHSRDMGQVRAAMQTWLAQQLTGASGLRITDLSTPSGTGLANETLLIDAVWEESGESRTGGFVVRVEAEDKLFPGSTAARQFEVCKALAGAPGVPLPRVLAFAGEDSPLGAPLYLMERVAGRVPADDPPFHAAGWVTELGEREREKLWRDAVAVMAALHRVEPQRLGFIEPRGSAHGLRANLDYYIEQIDRPVGEPHGVIDTARTWLLDHFPADVPPGVSWGDARVGNMIFRNASCVAVLDWDMVSLAGAEADLAWWCAYDLGYTVSKGISRLPGFGAPRETIALWEELAGRRAENMEWHFVFASYRIAVIVRRLARMLKAAGRLPPQSAVLERNNRGVQYLTTLLGLAATEGPVTMPWPGLDA